MLSNRPFYYAAIALSLLLAAAPVWAWDDEWTHARSGANGVIYDEGAKVGDSGVPDSDKPWKFFIPPPRDWANVDPNEAADYGRADYSPYALARITQDVKYNGSKISAGYYAIKPGGPNDGSPSVNLQTYGKPKPQPGEPGFHRISDDGSSDAMKLRLSPAVESGMEGDWTETAATMDMPIESDGSSPNRVVEDRMRARQQRDPAPVQVRKGHSDPFGNSNQTVTVDEDPTQTTTTVRKSSTNNLTGQTTGRTTTATQQKMPAYSVFVFKKLGNVVAVLPIHEAMAYKPPKGTKIPKQAVAWMDSEYDTGVERPVLRFYYKGMMYSTYFDGV